MYHVPAAWHSLSKTPACIFLYLITCMMKSEIALDWGLTQLGEKGDKWTSDHLQSCVLFFFFGGVCTEGQRDPLSQLIVIKFFYSRIIQLLDYGSALAPACATVTLTVITVTTCCSTLHYNETQSNMAAYDSRIHIFLNIKISKVCT